MRRLLTIDFPRLLERLLPSYKRQPKRLQLFGWPLRELTDLFAQYKTWRNLTYYRANVTMQAISIEAYLNRAIENSNNQIYIQSYNDRGIWVQTSTESGEAYVALVGTEAENTYKEVAKDGEIEPDSNVDFYVLIVPQSVSSTEVARLVEQYRPAGKRYVIQYQQ